MTTQSVSSRLDDVAQAGSSSTAPNSLDPAPPSQLPRNSASPEKLQQSSLPHKRVSMATRTDLANRRRSVLRDHKPPLGPRPPDFSPSRRITSTSTVNSAQDLPALPNSTSEPFFSQASRRSTALPTPANGFNEPGDSQSHFRKPSMQSTTSARSSKPISFHEAQLDDFPKPAAQRRQSTFRMVHKEPMPAQSAFAGSNVNGTAYKAVEQRDDPALRAAQLSTASTPTGPRISRYQLGGSRRQSQLPPSSLSNLSSKQPRKSVGPGLGASSTHEKVFDPHSRTLISENSQPIASAASRRSSQAAQKTRSAMSIVTSSNPYGAPKPSSLKGSPQGTTPPQHQSAHAFLDLPPPSATQENARSPSKAFHQQGSTPTTAPRRQSTAVGAGGLGARTISPTDVRRSRRMSVANRAPPLPTRSPTPEFAMGEKPPPTPPFAFRHKSMTPSSLHEMPEMPPEMPIDLPQRRNSGRSIESRSSYNSTRPTSRPTSSSSQRRSSFTNFSARSPTIKSRNLHSSGGPDSGNVPPVPAIPKAYESPSETMERPFFSDLDTTMNFSKALANVSEQVANEERFVTPEEGIVENHAPIPNHPQSRRLTLGARPEGRELPNLMTGRPQIHQHQRLPPINLLPLSTPTTNKIASMARRSTERDQGTSTPPPSKSGAKTPSTPMTASKATFPSYDFQHNFDMNLFPNFRSSTSYAAQKSETSTLNNESGSDSPAVVTPASPAPPSARHPPSPFGSFSLPRPNGDMQQYTARKNAESAKETSKDPPKETSQHGRKQSRSLLRRPSTVAKQNKDTASGVAVTSSDVDTPQSGTSLRRKLSKSWRRSASKASHSSQHVDDDHTVLSTDMPPPKLPASTTTRSNARKSPKPPVIATTSQTDLGASLNGARSANASHTELPLHAPKSSSAAGNRLQTGSKSSNSLFSPMSRMLGSRSSSTNMRTQRSTNGLDRDDQAAEDEMRKLGSKKKEFEASARELDELTRRAVAKERVSPQQATQMAALNLFEKGEIIDYQDEGVYFCGTRDAKKFAGDYAPNNSNFGFDDERGDYNIVMGDHLAFRYEVIDVLGKGSFGQVVRCVDHKTGGLVAVKIIRNKKRFHQQALVEVNILQKLREWDPDNTHSMVNFTQCFYFRGHLCIATELLGINLYEFIKAHDFSGFSLKLIRRFTKQMLSSLCLLQDKDVIHCDLKPENILLAHPLRSEIKTIDFGSSCFAKEKVYTYIQSRFYRSPEVILGMDYGIPIDMWSLGCILAELYTGFPIFPGENESEQLACIMEVFGPPEKHLIEKSSRKKVFFDSVGKPRICVSSKGKRRRPSSKTLDQVLKCNDEAFLDFLTRCLRWDPERRLKPQDAINHEFITGKKIPRTRSQYGASVASPAKRMTAVPTPNKSRLATEPPATSFKNGVATGSRTSSISPVKTNVPNTRRKSTMYDHTATSTTRVASGSGLPRATMGQRNTSGKPADLASAAAAISLAAQSKNRTTSNGVF